jgi:DNA primase
MDLQLDCRVVVEKELGPGRVYGASTRWPCPFHGGKDANFAVTEKGYRCFSKCDASGDAIAFIMAYRGLGYVDAVKYLGGESQLGQARQPIIIKAPTPQAPPRPIEAMTDIAKRAQDKLWGPDGGEGLDYLLGRGLLYPVIEAAGLGFIPNNRARYVVEGLTVFPGITLPSTYRGGVEFIQFRNIWSQEKGKRYLALGAAQGTLFGGDSLRPSEAVWIFEGAFDALIAKGMGLNAAALSGAKNALSPRWFAKIATAPKIIACGDNDEAGREFEQALAKLSPKVVAWKAPLWDLCEFHSIDPDWAQGYMMQLKELLVWGQPKMSVR